MNKEKIVYFAGAIRGDRAMADTMFELVKYIQALDLLVLTEHVVAKDPIAMVADKIGKRKDDLLAEDIELQDISWLDKATHVIAEISGASTGTGREIEYARTKKHFGKTPANILCLYHIDREFSASPMIRGMSPERYPNISVKAYRDIEDAKEIIQKFINFS